MEETMVTVAEILKMAPLHKLKVRAGKKYLDHEITDTVVMEVPDIKKWLHGGELLITSMYSIRGSVKEQCRLVKSLSGICSCIAIKTGNYIKEISKEVLQTAEDCQMPILEIPSDMTYSAITMAIMMRIADEQNETVMLKKYIADIIEENYSDPQQMIRRGLLFQFDFSLDSFLVLTPFSENRSSMVSFTKSLLNYAAAKYHCRCRKIEYNDGMLLIFQSSQIEMLEKMAADFSQEKSGGSELENGIISCGIGRPAKHIDAIRTSYFEAKQARRLGEILFPEETFYSSETLYFFGCAEMVLDRIDTGYFSDEVQMLQKEELLDTLISYYELRGNTKKMAEKMFVHPNTVHYRLRRIEELTQCRLADPVDNIKLYMAVFAYKLHRIETEPES